MTQTTTSQPSGFVAAVDVAKDKLDLATSDGDCVITSGNAPADHQRIAGQLAKRNPDVIFVEATGGYEWPLVQALLEAGLSPCLVRFAQLAQPRLLEKATENQVELAALVSCHSQLQQALTQQINRLGVTSSKTARRAKVITTLARQVGPLDAQIRKLIDSDDQFKDLDRRLHAQAHHPHQRDARRWLGVEPTGPRQKTIN